MHKGGRRGPAGGRQTKASPIILTLEANEAIDTNFSTWKRTAVCGNGVSTVEFDCPLGSQTYTCDVSLAGDIGTYFVDFMCPGVVPACMWWSEDEGEWEREGCTVMNYTSTNVTCACTHLTDFVLGKNVSAATVDVSYTSAPTNAPTPNPTVLPSPTPTPSPKALPSPTTTSNPTALPSSSTTTTTKPTTLQVSRRPHQRQALLLLQLTPRVPPSWY